MTSSGNGEKEVEQGMSKNDKKKLNDADSDLDNENKKLSIIQANQASLKQLEGQNSNVTVMSSSAPHKSSDAEE